MPKPVNAFIWNSIRSRHVRCWPIDEEGGDVSLPHVKIEKREHVGLPRRYAVEWKVVPFVRSPTDWRIDLEPVPLAKLSELSVNRLARIGRIVVLGVKEEKRDEGSTRGVEETRAELRRTVPAVASGGEDD